jgi:hypothetical protein
MHERYEIFPEWADDQKRYRIYDKETDSLLGLFGTLEEATRECISLGQAPRGPCGGEPGTAPEGSKASGDHENQQHD